MTSVLTLDEAAQYLRGDLEGHPTVEQTHVEDDRRPHRVVVHLPPEARDVPAGVEDIIEQHQATIEGVRHGEDGHWSIVLAPHVDWKPAGQRTVRAHGGSIVVTLTREALEASGLAEDTEVDLEARDGQVRFTRRDD